MSLPAGYVLGRPTPAEVDEILAMLHASDVASIGHPNWERSEVLEALTGPEFDPARDSWLVRAPAGTLVGWGYLEGRAFCEAYAHPDEPAEIQAPLLALLLDRVAERAAEHGLPELTACAGAIPTEDRYIRALTGAGFVFASQHARLTLDLTGDEKPPVPPAGVFIRPLRQEELRRFEEITNEAFGYGRTFEEFQALLAAQATTAWDEWFVAEADGELVGALRSSDQAAEKNEGWVKTLAVLPSHRGRGVARALLRTAFAVYAAKGRTAAGLGVDTNNPTGAYGLYTSLGMRVVFPSNGYERIVRASA